MLPGTAYLRPRARGDRHPSPLSFAGAYAQGTGHDLLSRPEAGVLQCIGEVAPRVPLLWFQVQFSAFKFLVAVSTGYGGDEIRAPLVVNTKASACTLEPDHPSFNGSEAGVDIIGAGDNRVVSEAVYGLEDRLLSYLPFSYAVWVNYTIHWNTGETFIAEIWSKRLVDKFFDATAFSKALSKDEKTTARISLGDDSGGVTCSVHTNAERLLGVGD